MERDIGTTQAFPYPLAVALDAVAHEWGHLSLESRGFRYNDCQTAQQWGISCDEWNAVHEGFGDVMGHSAEKKFQPAGTGPETSTDWTIGEDIGCDGGAGYLRSAGTYDWQGHSACGYSFNDTFHASDPYGAPPQDVHSRGNMLAVAFKMMTDGGSNPACVVGLGCNSTPAVGIEASNILYRTFTYYLTAGTFRWSQIGNYAVRAAYDFYNTCTSPFPPNDPATTEQNSVRTAFGNIGYPATSTCTCSQGCTQ